jgi:V/A-type H+/Na+-transporting ATPase subunit F
MARKIGVVGREEFILGFQLAGIRDAFATPDAGAFKSTIEDILENKEHNLGILVVQAGDVESLPPTTKRKLTDAIDPVVVQLGGEGGDLREKVKRAIGIDLQKE